MANLTSSLTMRLIDDVTKPAKSIDQALAEMAGRTKAIAKAMADTGATDRFAKSLSGLKLSAKDIDTVSAAWKNYAASASLSARAADWTRDQASKVRVWETSTIAALRNVTREQQRHTAEVARAARASEAARQARSVMPWMCVPAGGYHQWRCRAGGRLSGEEFCEKCDCSCC